MFFFFVYSVILFIMLFFSSLVYSVIQLFIMLFKHFYEMLITTVLYNDLQYYGNSLVLIGKTLSETDN